MVSRPGALNKQYNEIERFPDDFMFILTSDVIEDLVSQTVIPSKARQKLGGAKPYAFTEQE